MDQYQKINLWYRSLMSADTKNQFLIKKHPRPRSEPSPLSSPRTEDAARSGKSSTPATTVTVPQMFTRARGPEAAMTHEARRNSK
jgi:hypothetical protein